MDTIVIDPTLPEPSPPPPSRHTTIATQTRGFSPIFEDGDVKSSKQSVKGSKVSFEDKFDSDEENFSNRRHHFQQKKSTSSDHKNIFKVSFRLISFKKKNNFNFGLI